MILKLLLIIAVIATVYFLFFKKEKEVTHNKKNNTTPPTSDMVECATCGVYTPLEESILSGAKYYCSEECLKGTV